MIRSILSIGLAVAVALQPIAASAQMSPYFRFNPNSSTASSGSGPVTPTPGTDEPVRGTGDLAIYLPVQIRARLGVPFSLQIVASNAEGAVSWSSVGSALPLGLSFNPSTGFLTGTPTRIESSPRAKFAGVDSAGKAGESPSLVIDVQPVPTVTVNASYTLRTGEVSTITPRANPVFGSQTWNLIGSLPLGLSLDPGTGAIAGTARQQGTYPDLKLRVTDADGATGVSPPFSIVVNSNIAITGLPKTIPARIGQQMATVRPFASGTPGPYQWSVSDEATPLPAGLTLNPTTGAIGGTAAAAGTTSGIALKIVDSTTGYSTISPPFSVAAAPAPSISVASAYNVRQGPNSMVSVAPVGNNLLGGGYWSATNKPPYGFEVFSGTISGPTGSRASYPGITFSVIDMFDGAKATSAPTNLNIWPNLAIGYPAVPMARVGTAFTMQAPPVYGLMGTATFKLNGSLPAGLTLDEATGVVSGTPTTVQVATVSMEVKDSADGVTRTHQSPFSITVLPPEAELPLAVSLPSEIPASTERFLRVTPVASGAKGATSWSLSGTLPGWALFEPSTGVIAGTPNQVGTTSGLRLTVTDASNGATASSEPFSIVVSPFSAPTATMATPLQAMVGEPFTSPSPSPTGLSGPATFSLTSGNMPEGLSINETTGVISGVPEVSGEVPNLIVSAVDQAGAVAPSNPFTIVVSPSNTSPAVAMASRTLTTSEPFATTPTVQNSNAPANWVLESGTLPGWATLNASNGSISGTPPQQGAFGPFVLKVTDRFSRSARTSPFTFTVVDAPQFAVSMPSSIPGMAGNTFQASPNVVGARGATTWTVSGTLPAGLSLNPSNGVISGVPAAMGVASGLVLSATDSTNATVSSNAFSIAISPSPLAMQPYPAEIKATYQVPFASQAPSVLGNVGAVTWTLAAGTLPSWATLEASTGRIVGTPTTLSTTPGIRLRATDTNGTNAQTSTFTLVAARPDLTAQAAPSYFHVNSPVGVVPSAPGLVGAPTWTLTSGTLPSGLTLDPSTGRISGTLASPATASNLVLTVRDAFDGVSASTNPFLIAVLPPPTISTLSSYQGTRNATLTATPSVSDAIGAQAWTLVSGTLPPWAQLNATTGAISGTPSDEATFPGIVLGMTDSAGGSATSQPFSIVVGSGMYATTLATTYHPRVGKAFASDAPIVFKNAGAVSWTVATGTLPSWATLDPATGVVHGTPDAPSTATVTLRMTDASTATATTQGLTVSNKAASYGGRIFQPFSMAPVTIGNAIGSLSWSLQPNTVAPAGLGVSPSNGTITGTPSVAVTTTVSVVVRDSADQASLVVPYSVAISPELKIGAIGTLRFHEGRPFSTPAPTVSGQRGSLNWTLASGTLPGWLTLDAQTGILTGTAPAIANVGPIALVATDSADQVSSPPSELTISIIGALGVANLPTSFTARYGMPFTSARPTAVNPVGAATWAWGAGSSPPGWVSLNAATGVLTGTPTQLGTASGLTLVVTDSTGALASSAPFTLNVFSQPDVAVSAYTLKQRVGDPIAVTATATGLSGTPTWSLVYQSGSDPIPAGITQDPVNGGLNGTPTGTGSSSFSIRVVDGNDLAVADSPLVSMIVSPTFSLSGMAPAYYGRVGSFLALDLPTTQGQVDGVTYSLSLQTGALPAGFSMVDNTTGQIRGVPSAPLAPTQATLIARDAFDNKAAVATFTLGIRPQLAIGAIANVSLRNETAVGNELSPSVSGLFFPAAVQWTANGQLPNGVFLDPSTGKLTGKPTGYATSLTFPNITLTARDLTDGSETTSSPFSIAVNAGLSVTTTQAAVSLRAGTSLTTVAPTVTGLGGSPTWSLVTRAGNAQPYSIVASTGVATISPSSSASGTWAYDLVVTDSADNRIASTQVTATIVPATTVAYTANTVVAPSAPVNLVPTVGNKLGNLQFSLASGTLPSGITLDGTTGVISGSTTVLGATTVTVKALDTDGYQALSNTVRISVSNAPDVYLGAVPSGKIGRPFALTPTSDVSNVTWTLTGTLPAGLSFNASSGAITGTPTTVGTSGTLTINARNNATSVLGSSDPFTIATSVGNAITVSSAAAKWRQGLASTTSLAISNAVGAVTWSVSSGVLPTGVTINPSTGAISGTPTQFGTYAVTVQAVDSENARATLSTSLSIETGPALSYPTSSLRPNVTASVAPRTQYLQGSPTWTLVSGTLPAGLAFDPSNGTISGSPTTATATPTVVSVRLADADGASVTANASILVSANAFVIDAGGTSFNATAGTDFSLRPVAYVDSQNVGQYVSWAIVGSLPNGLTFDPITGVISGRPTSLGVGTKTFSISATYNQASASSPTLTIVVADRPAPVVTVPTASLTVSRGAPLSIQPTVANAVGNVSWTLDSGTLPPGVTISPTTGLVSGTVTAIGNSQFKIRATDQSKVAASPTISVTVQDGMSVSVTEVSSNNRAGKAYLANLTATGGTGAVVWNVQQGQLPPGIALNPQMGTLSGSTPTAGTWSLVLRAVDSTGAYKDLNHTVAIAVGPSVTTITNQAAVVGKSFSLTPSAVSTVGAVSWSVVGTLPAGLSIPSAATGTISGSPSTGGTANDLRLAVVDADGLTAVSNPFSITVQPSGSALSLTYAPTIYIRQGEATSVSPALVGATGATQSYTLQYYSGGSWSNAPNGIVPGLSFNTSTGVISGTPTAGSGNAFRVYVTDNRSQTPVGATSSQFYFSLVPADAIKASVPPVNEVVRGQNLTIAPSVTGAVGTVSYTLQYLSGSSWYAYSAGAVATGVNYDAPTGVISGAPTSAASAASAYRYYVQDSRGSGAYSNQFTINILPWAQPQVRYPDNSTLPRGEAISITPTVTDAPGTRSFYMYYNSGGSWFQCPSSTCAGYLPGGLSFNSTDGSVSGTMTGANPTYSSFRVYFQETRSGQTLGTYSNQFTLNVAPWVAPTISMDSTLVFQRGVAGTRTPTVQGVTGTLGGFTLYMNSGGTWYNCTNCAGQLPVGLNFNTTDGSIYGTVTGAGATYQSYYVTASETRQGQTLYATSNTFTVNVQNWTLPSISYPERTTYVAGQPFTLSPTVTGVSGTLSSYTFYYYNGSSQTQCPGTCTIIPGLTFNTTTGVVTGTPTGTASYSFVAYLNETRMGQTNPIQTKSFWIGPAPAAGPTLTYGTANLIDGTVNQPLDVAPTLSSGSVTGAYTLSGRTIGTQTGTGDFNSNSLPGGISFNTATGRFTATAVNSASAGTWRAYKVCAPTTAGTACTPELIFRIADRPAVAIDMPTTYIDVVRYGSVDVTPAVRNVVGAVTFARSQILSGTVLASGSGESVSTSWPAGISFDTSTGRIYGSPTATGIYRGFALTATDSQGANYRGVTPEILIRVSDLPAMTVSAPAVVETTNGASVDVSATARNAYGTVTWQALTTKFNGVVADGTTTYANTTLPAGLSYASGRVSGTISATLANGDYRGYRICGTDEASRTACTDEIIFRVSPPAALAISTPPIVTVTQGSSVAILPTASNVVGTLTWNANVLFQQFGGASQGTDYVQAWLPIGLSYSATDGSIRGTVSLTAPAGRYRSYAVRAADSRATSATSKEIIIDVVAAPTLTLSTPLVVDMDRGTNVSVVPTVANAIGTVVWSASLSTQVTPIVGNGSNEFQQAALPTGLSYSGTNGSISGLLGAGVTPGRYRGYRIGARDDRGTVVYTQEIILNVR